jgi:hypothetical protein
MGGLIISRNAAIGSSNFAVSMEANAANIYQSIGKRLVCDGDNIFTFLSSHIIFKL